MDKTLNKSAEPLRKEKSCIRIRMLQNQSFSKPICSTTKCFVRSFRAFMKSFNELERSTKENIFDT